MADADSSTQKNILSRRKNSHNRLNIAGQRFDRITVLREAGTRYYPSGTGHSLWICQCDCGTKTLVIGPSLTGGNTKSCGCLAREMISKRSASHRMTGTRTYRIWQAMLTRCNNEKTINYAIYGGRGITVCERWRSFENFLADMGEAEPGMSIDRIDNDGNYEPSNCRWADRATQSRNRSTNRMIEFNGERKCLKDWADGLGIDQASLRERLDSWPLERALTEPKRQR